MYKITAFALMLIVFNIQIGRCQKNTIELRSYLSKEYSIKDSVVFFATNLRDSLEKIWFSIDIIEDSKWGEYDNDIYMKEPRTFKYFYLKKSKQRRFTFYLKNLDSTLKNTTNLKLRIVLNTYPTWLKGSKQYPFQAFTIKK